MDIDELFKTFKKQGYISFNLASFFPELTEYSDRFYEICDENWSWIIKNKQGENDFYPKQHPLSLIEKEKRAAFSDYTNGLFSFSFRRIIDDHIGNSVIDFFEIKK